MQVSERRHQTKAQEQIFNVLDTTSMVFNLETVFMLHEEEKKCKSK